MNAPAPFESFLVFDGEKKITIEKDTKVPNAAIFTVNKEDHTIGNLLKHQLLKDPQVLFAGYKCPHPLEHKFVLRIQTTSDTTPADALTSAITDLMAELSLFEERFRVMMLTNHLTSPPSTSSPSSYSTIFRVRRKRTADPLGALVISLKRAKQMPAVTEPIICFRTSTTDLKHFNIIDVDPHQNIINAVNLPSSNIDEVAEDSDNKSEISTTNPVELMKDFAEEPSSSSKIISETTIKSSQITLNGEPMVVLSNQDDEVRLANADDLLCDGEDTESSAGEDDDEDSNDENNWRNDYPDESEHTSGCGSDEDTASDGFDDYEDLEKHIGKMGFYDEDSEGDEDS
ncbi:RNA polymerase Rpb3/Rpb11 dimerization domain protein [Onchocerca flexuosa]|uniref:Probable DNA-directed RNA polymerase II subunit RPB11 n=1 Tax=Onchocerca flexuosa TaxID=387005 RepID=A0A238BT66_9BILA|nr:RNA polymerase Rpb3/Rpb11 dimerization domain protein [Onchocerca flexuosa]